MSWPSSIMLIPMSGSFCADYDQLLSLVVVRSAVEISVDPQIHEPRRHGMVRIWPAAANLRGGSQEILLHAAPLPEKGVPGRFSG